MLQVGDHFEIKCRHMTIEVVCLSAGQQSRLLSLMSKIQKAEKEQTMEKMGDLFHRALTMCIGDEAKANQLFEEQLDFEMIGEVIAATTQKNALTDEEKKTQD